MLNNNPTSGNATKRMNVEVPKEEYLAIKSFAALNDQSVSDLVRKSVANTMAYDAWFRQRVQASLDRLNDGSNQVISAAKWQALRERKLAEQAALGAKA